MLWTWSTLCFSGSYNEAAGKYTNDNVLPKQQTAHVFRFTMETLKIKCSSTQKHQTRCAELDIVSRQREHSTILSRRLPCCIALPHTVHTQYTHALVVYNELYPTSTRWKSKLNYNKTQAVFSCVFNSAHENEIKVNRII